MPFFDSLKKEMSHVGRDLQKGINDVSKAFQAPTDATQAMFTTGNVVQLISRSSGLTLQIVQAQTGQLVVDGRGPEGPTFMHAHWTVFNEGHHIVKLYNQSNYLAMINGALIIMSVADPALAGAETRFRLLQNGNFLSLESAKESGKYIGINQDGTLRSALVANTGNMNQFACRLIYTPYPPGGAANVTTVTTVTHTQQKR